MPALTSAWFTAATPDSDDWTDETQLDDVRTVSDYDKIVLTIRCLTAPSEGLTTVKFQHSADHGIVETASANWETLWSKSFDSNQGSTQHTESFDNFHSKIRITVTNTVASQSPVLNVYIREKQIGSG